MSDIEELVELYKYVSGSPSSDNAFMFKNFTFTFEIVYFSNNFKCECRIELLQRVILRASRALQINLWGRLALTISSR